MYVLCIGGGQLTRNEEATMLFAIFIFSNARTVRGRWRKDSNADVHSMGRPAACLGSSSL